MIYKLQSENPKNQLKVEKLMKTKTARAKNVLQTLEYIFHWSAKNFSSHFHEILQHRSSSLSQKF